MATRQLPTEQETPEIVGTLFSLSRPLGYTNPESLKWRFLSGGKESETAFRLMCRILGLLRMFPLVDDSVVDIQSTLVYPVVIKLVRDADDPDLDAALNLYAKRIPDDQRFESADIVRWIPRGWDYPPHKPGCSDRFGFVVKTGKDSEARLRVHSSSLLPFNPTGSLCVHGCSEYSGCSVRRSVRNVEFLHLTPINKTKGTSGDTEG